ncbi:hypothetical protein Tco_0382064 [Tanacetum coccineum]
MVKNKGLVAEAYEWDEEDVSSDYNEMVEVKVLMALIDDEIVAVGKESAINGEWVNILMKKVHIVLTMEDNDDRNTFLDYLCIDLNYVEEQRNNLLSKHKDLVQELNTCKEPFVSVNKFPLKRKEFLELINLLKIPLVLGKKTWSFVKSSADETKVSIPGLERPCLFEVEGFILPNHDTGRILPAESQMKVTDPLVTVTDSLATEYDSADESSVCSTPLPPLSSQS